MTTQPQLFNVPIESNSYKSALAEYNKYSASQKEPVFLVYCTKTHNFHAWNMVTRKGIESYRKSFRIILATDKLN